MKDNLLFIIDLTIGFISAFIMFFKFPFIYACERKRIRNEVKSFEMELTRLVQNMREEDINDFLNEELDSFFKKDKDDLQ